MPAAGNTAVTSAISTRPPTTAGSTTTSATTPAAKLDVAAVFNGDTIVLSGSVANTGERDDLLTAARVALDNDATKVVNRMTVVDKLKDATDKVNDPIAGKMATLLSTMPKNLVSGEVGFHQRLYLRGVYATGAGQRSAAGDANLAGVAGADVQLTERPKPTTAQVTSVVDQLNALFLAESIQFEQSQALIVKASEPVLDEAAAKLRQFDLTGITINVDGYTDSDGTTSSNLRLSQQRADAVRAALIERDVPRASLKAIGHGEANPIAPNDTAENKAKNRRVVFSVSST